MKNKQLYITALLALIIVVAIRPTLSWAYAGTSSAAPQKAAPINVNKLGIAGDGKSDITAKLQQAVAQHKSLYFPKGTYIISRQIELSSGNTLTGVPGAVVTNRADFSGESFFTADTKQDINIRSITFTNKITAKPVYAVLLRNACANILLKQLMTTQCGVLHTRIDNASYRQVANKQQQGSRNIIVSSCSGKGSPAVMGIYLEYASNWQVINSAFTNYHHGVEWWGGDSNPQRDGQLDNARLCQRGQVTNVTVSHITEGGIWGSMGDGITVSRCKVYECGDVGIDFEGCFNSRAIGNTVSNCKNGALATFHYNKGIVFSNNTVSQNNPAFPLARIYNASQTINNRDITFTGNSFAAVAGVGLINQSGPAQSIRFSNNKLSNVVLDFSFNNNQVLQIDHNTITLTRRNTTSNFMVKAGNTNNNGRVVLENNVLSNTAALNPAITGIYVTQFDYNTSPVNLINNNTLNGIKKPYKVEWNGQNAGVVSKTYINTPQKLSANAIEKAGQAKSASEVYINNGK